MIIHISGTPGSGKTYILEKLKKINKKIKLIDTDIWRDEYYLNNTKKSYILFIENKLKKLKNYDIVVLCGVLDDYIDNKFVFPKINATYKYFIDIDIHTLFLQRNKRLLNNIYNHKNKYIKLLNNYKIPKFLSLEEIKNEYDNDINIYVKKYKYILSTQKNIINEIKNIQLK